MAEGVTTGPWWVVLIAAVPSAASGLWVAYRWIVEHGDKQEAVGETRQERLTREMDAQRAGLAKEQAELFDRVRAELLRTQARLTEVEHDRDRGWDLARWWNRRCSALVHAGNNLLAWSVSARERHPELPPPKDYDLTIPGLEEPK